MKFDMDIYNRISRMDDTSFSGFNIVFGMDLPVIVPSKPLTARCAFNSPLLRALASHVDDIEPLKEVDDFVEPILRENPNRFTLFPIMKPKLFQKYKRQKHIEAMH